ncbi:interleukin-34 isoform X2 [Scleropages formosus]|uniref:interleukin-34 isoform X2 n=1 Tax=Scleropages formosus TaxID=113540 RepID=UPI0008790A6B|nr:uncharacterized protein LOC108918971 isoform X2 [Scleropages formosus]
MDGEERMEKGRILRGGSSCERVSARRGARSAVTLKEEDCCGGRSAREGAQTEEVQLTEEWTGGGITSVKRESVSEKPWILAVFWSSQRFTDSMSQFTQILVVLLGCLCAVHASTNSPPICKPMNTVKHKLSSSQRREYMKYNFPINYTLPVHHEEIVRVSNITLLREQLQLEHHDLDWLEADIQDLWFFLYNEVLKKLLRILPEKHPSRNYTFEVQDLLLKVQHFAQQLHENPEERLYPERIEDTWHKVTDPHNTVWKWVKPKALMDNFYRSMHCVFPYCFPTKDGQPDWLPNRLLLFLLLSFKTVTLTIGKKSRRRHPRIPEVGATSIQGSLCRNHSCHLL